MLIGHLIMNNVRTQFESQVQGLKSPIQWIFREWVRKLGSNELDNNYGGSRWLESKNKEVLPKEVRPQLSSRRLVFIYIVLEFDYKSNSCFYSVFLLISWFSFLRVFFPFYTIFFFHLHPPHVDQVIGVDPCPISTFLKSLGVTVRLKITV